MTKQSWRYFSLMLIAFLALSLVPSLPVSVQAQDGGGQDAAEVDAYQRYYDDKASVTGGDAEWTLSDSQFTSNYPNGFTFTAKASSTGGDVVSASVFYSFNPRFEEDRRQRGEVNAETGDITVTLDQIDARDIPPWIEVNYRWRLTDAAGTVYLSDWIIGSIYADNTREWLQAETDDALIYVQEGVDPVIIEYMTDALAERHELYLEFFGREISYRPRAIFFKDVETFNEWRALDVNRGGAITVGLSSGAWGGTVQLVFGGDLRALGYATLVHEIAHQYQFDLYETYSLGWFTEGVASYFEIDKDYDYEQRVRNLAAAGGIPPLFDEFGGPSPDDVGIDGRPRLGYDIGYTVIKWMIETYGYESHRAMIEYLGAEDYNDFEFVDVFNAAIEEVFGKTPLEWENEYRAWIGAEPRIPDPEPVVVENPTLAAGTEIPIEGFRPLFTRAEPGKLDDGAVCSPGTNMTVLQTVQAPDGNRYVQIECDGGIGWLPESQLLTP